MGTLLECTIWPKTNGRQTIIVNSNWFNTNTNIWHKSGDSYLTCKYQCVQSNSFHLNSCEWSNKGVSSLTNYQHVSIIYNSSLTTTKYCSTYNCNNTFSDANTNWKCFEDSTTIVLWWWWSCFKSSLIDESLPK
jgi:hypothetical protein